MFQGRVVKPGDPEYAEILLVNFLQGRGLVLINDDVSDPTKDDALRAMPSVALDAGGGRTTLRVAMSTRAFEALDPDWFDDQGAPDALAAAARWSIPRSTRPRIRCSIRRIRAIRSFRRGWCSTWRQTPPTRRITMRRRRCEPRSPRRGRICGRGDASTCNGRDPRRANQRRAAAHVPAASALLASGRRGRSHRVMRLPLSGTLYLPLPDGAFTWYAIPRQLDPADSGNDPADPANQAVFQNFHWARQRREAVFGAPSECGRRRCQRHTGDDDLRVR